MVALRDRYPNVRQAAADALVKIGLAGSGAVGGGAKKSATADVRQVMAEALAKIGTIGGGAAGGGVNEIATQMCGRWRPACWGRSRMCALWSRWWRHCEIAAQMCERWRLTRW